MTTFAQQVKLTGLARRLVLDNIISEAAALEAQKLSVQDDKPLIKVLIDQELAMPADIAQVASQEYGIPLFDLSIFEREQLPTDQIKPDLIEKYHALPLFKRGNRLFVAISDPMNLAALDELKFSTGVPSEPVLVEDDKLRDLIDVALSAADGNWGDMISGDETSNLKFGNPEETQEQQSVKTSEIDDTPIVQFVNKMLLDAIRRSVSDIHLETYEKTFRVRFRMDGILHEVGKLPVQQAPKVVARIKVMSRMDISERRVPQDGRIKLNISKTKSMDFRVNTCPTMHGEKIVLRLLDSSATSIGIDSLGYDEAQKNAYLKALAKPYGMILVTGPTGSGKTVSLYSGLSILNTSERNISTAEDPAEINIPGINQVNVNVKVGLTFANAMRAFLRQDPDVIMVGEIRDLETAEIAIKAAQTGHMVLSTLHTNDAPQTLSRLANMGVPPYNIASSISLIIAQRLARKLCPNCKVVHTVPTESLIDEGFLPDEIDTLKIFKPVGCQQCTNGYKGRTGIFQVLTISEDMGRLIMEGGNSLQMAAQARKEGVKDLRQSGLDKVRQGITSLEEINRVTKD